MWTLNLLLAHWGLSLCAAYSVPSPPSVHQSHSAIPQLLHTSIDEIQGGLRHKHFTSVQLVEAYLKRIDEVNPDYNAVLEVNPDALAIAQSLDAERAAGGARGFVCVFDVPHYC